MKYVVLGAAGQLGQDFCRLLADDAKPLTRTDGDLLNPAQLRQTLAKLRPATVINCAAYNHVDRAEVEQAKALAVNAWAVNDLAEICASLDCTLVHFSTDYVFGRDLLHCMPYSEDDAPGMLSFYGFTKYVGEHLAQRYCRRHVVIRTCGLYGLWGSGGKRGNFVETMLTRAREGKPLRVVNDQVCTPSYTADVAAGTVALLETGRHGLFHLTNSGSCSWYDFAKTIFEYSGFAADVQPISTKNYGAAATRPAFSVLDNGKAQSAGMPPLRSWQAALRAYLNERTAR